MNQHNITDETINRFRAYLIDSEKAPLTIQKYIREISALKSFSSDHPVSKSLLLEYRTELQRHNSARTVNAKLSAVNAYLRFAGLENCRVKFLRIQHSAFIDDNRELTKEEYRRLLSAAKQRKDQRLYFILLTLGNTGIRVSELQFITVEAVRRGRADISLKGKTRTVILPKKLAEMLRQFACSRSIKSGILFRTRNGKPVDRSNIFHDMKKLCANAGVSSSKVFPHNLRHLFARCYYAVQKNLSYLADILGHSSLQTTRIYVAAGIREHERILHRMKLLM